jgi:hypothetical protein
VAEKPGGRQDRVFQVRHGTEHTTYLVRRLCHLNNYTTATERCPMETGDDGALGFSRSAYCYNPAMQ